MTLIRRPRLVLSIGKVVVERVNHTPTQTEFLIELTGGVKLVLKSPPADVRLGDLLPVYTEVLVHAHSESSSFQ